VFLKTSEEAFCGVANNSECEFVFQ